MSQFNRIFMSPAAGPLAEVPPGELISFHRMLIAFRNDGEICYIGIPAREGEDPSLLNVRLTAASYRLMKMDGSLDLDEISIPDDLELVVRNMDETFPPYVSRNHLEWTDVTMHEAFTWIVSSSSIRMGGLEK